MLERFICCATCQRRWPVTTQECTYLELDLMSRPCPYCEGYTLSVTTETAAVSHLRRRRLRWAAQLVNMATPAQS